MYEDATEPSSPSPSPERPVEVQSSEPPISEPDPPHDPDPPQVGDPDHPLNEAFGSLDFDDRDDNQDHDQTDDMKAMYIQLCHEGGVQFTSHLLAQAIPVSSQRTVPTHFKDIY